VKCFGLKPQGTLQRFEQSNVLGDIIVLVSDPFGDSDCAVGGAVNDDSNARRARIPERAAIDVSHEICHCVSELVTTMRDQFPGVKMLTWFPHTFLVATHAFEHLWMFLCKNGKNLISHSLSNNDSTGYVSGS
jgi:hypothetical protein